MYTVQGIQHLGVGVPQHADAWAWYRKFFGMDIPFFNDEAGAPLMDIYTENKTITKRAAMILNLQGGCAMEVVCPTTFQAAHAEKAFQIGDLGIYTGFIKSLDVKKAYTFFKENNADLVTDLIKMPNGWDTFYVKDIQGQYFQVIPTKHSFTNAGRVTNGIAGCSIGVSDIAAAMKLYSSVLGYDKVVYDTSEVFADWSKLPGGEGKFRRVLLTQAKPSGGGFSKLSGETYIELVQDLSERKPIKIYEGRLWGDIGFVHLGFDVRGMKNLGEELDKVGFGFTCDTKNVLSMGDATKVHCTYIEDPDGTLIELIEVYKIPIIEKLGINLNVGKRHPSKPLPNIMLKALKFSRIKE